MTSITLRSRYGMFMAALIIGAGLLSFAGSASAAPSRAYLDLPSAPVPAGTDVSVRVLVDSATAVNAIDLQVAYPASDLAFIREDSTGSIVSFWQSGSMLLSKGHVRLSGALAQPFEGTAGLVATLHFKTIVPGPAVMAFERSVLYRADGTGAKIPVPGVPSTLSIGPALSIQPGSDSLDATPPSLSVRLVKDPLTGRYLIVYDAADPDSGIRSVEMRVRRLWWTGPWQAIMTPAAYPSILFGIDIRATNQAGGETMVSVPVPGTHPKTIFAIILILVVTLAALVVYNRKRFISKS